VAKSNIHHWTFSTCLPYFLDYRIFVYLHLCSQLSTCFFEEFIFALFQIFNSFLQFFNLNGSKGILVDVELWFKTRTYILSYLSSFFSHILRHKVQEILIYIPSYLKKFKFHFLSVVFEFFPNLVNLDVDNFFAFPLHGCHKVNYLFGNKWLLPNAISSNTP